MNKLISFGNRKPEPKSPDLVMLTVLCITIGLTLLAFIDEKQRANYFAWSGTVVGYLVGDKQRSKSDQ